MLALILAVANVTSYNRPIVVTSGLVATLGFILIFTVLPVFALGLHSLLRMRAYMKTKTGGVRSYGWYLALLGILLGALALLSVVWRPGSIPIAPVTTPTQSPPSNQTLPDRSISILVDDFSPQPYQGQTVYFFNRLEGDRGAINNSVMDWGLGLVTTTISAGNSWGGTWMSLNHPIREGLPINFSAILPAQILPDYQSQITGLTVRIAGGTPGATFRLELKYHGDLQWKHEIELTGRDQTIELELPPLGNINEFVWVLDRSNTGDYVVLDSVSFTATTSSADTAMDAFLWS